MFFWQNLFIISTDIIMFRQLTLIALSLLMGTSLFAQDKQVITRADQLPRRTYQLPNTNLTELLEDKAALKDI